MSSATQILVRQELETVDLVLVDDDKLTLEIVSWILKNSTISSKLFTDPKLASEYLKKVTPAILIVDYYMPGINGLEFLSALAENQKSEATKKFLCSAVVPRNESSTIMRLMGVRLLEKQVICDRTALLELIEQNLEEI